ncbi:amidohydrolase family protein [Amycolatopsis methanolica]|uniref:2-amino-3-carboxymuconate-6-semialdehyde decarboxylase n=1 Tax=Amycolatopsis methanolica 239 TaxID=1068978 RepID=A0A076MTZ9_AMYME|nr:amidohydrolase family protein [Amycolatopsis methanolica]AIJ21282.1 2-amino-3-carboxylmuconate-6-semialdehyde decarboxylase [Amycolatopsis methanolica 239]
MDLHTHYMPAGLPSFAESKGDSRWPRLVPGSGGQGEIVRGTSTFRVVRQACWDITERISEMDRFGVDVQVISPVPVSLTYWASGPDAAEFARIQNDEIAEAVRGSAGRLIGFAGVPLQDTDLAIEEMRRVVGELGLHGIEIGTVVGTDELDHERLRPFFAAAARLGVPLLVHPIDGPCIGRSADPLGAFSIGMLTDTAVAARALVCGGVLTQLPDLRVCLCHGGGSFPWIYPRLRFGAVLDGDDSTGDRLDADLRRLFVDSLVFDPRHYALLTERFGTDHVVLGTDYPFFSLDGPGPDLAMENGLSEHDRAAIRGRNALDFLQREHIGAARS